MVGLMSGTSVDGLDAALLEIDGSARDATWSLLAFRSEPYSDRRRAQIRECIERGSPARLSRLHVDLGEWMAEAALALLEQAGVPAGDVRAIGSHGHTVWHIPPASGYRGATLQLGDPATIAERTGIAVVADLRMRDMAVGGQGAPLVPFADRILFALPRRRRALQNLGGIGNVTWLPERDSGYEVLAFDTGPANTLLDLAAERATHGRLRCDVDGELARQGTVDEPLVARLMTDPFFNQEPPRSTGRERFGKAFLDAVIAERPQATVQHWADLLATLTQFTARSVGDAYRRWLLPRGVDEVVLTGGGRHNTELVRRITSELAPIPVAAPETLGLDPDAREAAAFAVLAWAHVLGVAGNVPAATGAAAPRVLGSLTPAAGGRCPDPGVLPPAEP